LEEGHLLSSGYIRTYRYIFVLQEETRVWDEETEFRSSGHSVRRFIITGVADPRKETPDFISLKDAVAKGIINERRGLYINPATRVSTPIAEAMNKGLIQVEM
jgi:hypothetical protein